NGGIAHLLRNKPLSGIPAAIQLLRRQHFALARRPVDIYHVNWLQNALALPPNEVPALVTVLGTDMQLLQLPFMRTLLRRKFRDRPVAICPNADWMLPSLKTAFGDIAAVKCVPFGIDAHWYAVERRLDAGAPKWLCVSRL